MARLDRALAHLGFTSIWERISGFVLPRSCSYHHPILVTCALNSVSGPLPFRFQKMWLLHSDFHSLIADNWAAFPGQGNRFLHIMSNFKRLREVLRGWNFGDINRRIEAAQSDLLEVQQDISDFGYSTGRANLERERQTTLNLLLAQQYEFLKQKGRSQWLRDGDRNTAYLNRKLKSKHAKARLDSMVINGAISTDSGLIRDHVVSYYSTLLTADSNLSSDFALVDTVISDSITDR